MMRSDLNSTVFNSSDMMNDLKGKLNHNKFYRQSN